MRLSRLFVPLVAVAGVSVGAIPSLTSGAAPRSASPSTASFTAVDYRWVVAGGGTTVTVAAGGTVDFSYPTGHSMHNVDFGSGPQPSSCETGGAMQAAPIPSAPAAPGWTGSCTFTTPGTYTFHCDMHPSMIGTVVVTDAGTTTTTTTTITTTTTTTSTGTTTGTTTTGTTTTSTGPAPVGLTGGVGMTTTTTAPAPTPSGTSTTPSYSSYPSSPTTSTPASTGPPRTIEYPSPLGQSPKHAIIVAARQHGLRITGTIDVSSAGHSGHALIALIATSRGHRVRLGQIRLRRIRSGRVRFVVVLDHKATVLLGQSTQLEVAVTITVTAPSGATVSVARHVRLEA
jgi:plastocyanin